ncbi:MAG: Glu/Leu/Phe/Val dehydrogenase [Candidatus Aenigmarchaeota archaeon]|nr:Glu/Leu/Phe/Val dehydrogenase [Candidatus Aenigmarchaeota archaeon]
MKYHFSDKFGPEQVIEVEDKKIGLKGVLVIDNTKLGPGKGGIRMTPTVNTEEVFRLARTMTLKTALAGIPFGGAKSGIIASHEDIKNKEMKKILIQAFSKALRDVVPKKYIAAPDVNTAEEEMKWFAEANGNWNSCTGKPADYCEGKKCGLPHELGSTGFGVAYSTLVAIKHKGLHVKKTTIAIEGFGNVGTFAAKHLSEFGAKIVAVSDSKGVIYNEDGLNYKKLMEAKEKTGSVTNYKPGKVLENKELFELKVDVLIPGALPDVITKNNVNNIKAKIIVEAANIPTTDELESMLHRHGILVVPDFVANAGGVISSYCEYMGYTPKKMFKIVQDKITKNTKLVLDRAMEEGIKPRDAALKIAEERIMRKNR